MKSFPIFKGDQGPKGADGIPGEPGLAVSWSVWTCFWFLWIHLHALISLMDTGGKYLARGHDVENERREDREPIALPSSPTKLNQ